MQELHPTHLGDGIFFSYSWVGPLFLNYMLKYWSYFSFTLCSIAFVILSTSRNMPPPTPNSSSKSPLLEYGEDPTNWPLTRKWPFSSLVLWHARCRYSCNCTVLSMPRAHSNSWNLGLPSRFRERATIIRTTVWDAREKPHIPNYSALVPHLERWMCRRAEHQHPVGLSLLGRFLWLSYRSAYHTWHSVSNKSWYLLVTNAGGALTDMWSQSQRAVPLAVFTAASYLSVVLGPILGGYITQYASWQWYECTRW